MTNNIFTNIPSRQIFLNTILPQNPGYIFIKFGASWCKPCQTIKNCVYFHFNRLQENNLCFDIDIDQNSDIYAFFKGKKMIRGVPSIMVWQKENLSFVPDDFISGGSIENVDIFFNKYK